MPALCGEERGPLRPRSGLMTTGRLLGECFFSVEENNSRDKHNGKEKKYF